MVKKLRINESKEDRLFNVMNSRVVRNKLDEFRDMYYNQGIYEEEFNGRIFPHEITDVRCTIDDVYYVLGNPGIYDVICHAEIKWDYDEQLDTVGTREMFSFYYDPENDVIVDDSEIVNIEENVTTTLKKRKSVKENIHDYKEYEDFDESFKSHEHNLNESPYPKGSTGDLANRIVQALGVEEPYGESTDEIITELEEFFGIDFGFSKEDRFLEWDEVSDEIFEQLADQPKKKLLKYAKVLDDYGYRV